jgi:hypothetical protein
VKHNAHTAVAESKEPRPDSSGQWASPAKTLHFWLAESRFLNIHPFQDFNTRILVLLEWLRRLDLPHVTLAPESMADRQSFFHALEAAYRANWHSLIQIWQPRFTANA